MTSYISGNWVLIGLNERSQEDLQMGRGNICVAESTSSLHCGIHIFMIVYIFDNSTIASDMIFNDVI